MSKLPKSSTNFFIACLSCFLFFLLFFIFYNKYTGLSGVALYLILALSLMPLFLADIFSGKNFLAPSKKLRNINHKRIAIKFTGLLASYGFVAFCYWLFPNYTANSFSPYWQHLKMLLPFVFAVSLPYIIYVDNRMGAPEDGYYHLGLLVLQRRQCDKKLVWEHIKCWIVKGFFLALMSIYFLGNLNYFYKFNFDAVAADPKKLYDLAYNLIFTIDLLFAVIGYIFTLKLFNSQIQSTEPTLLGWAVCLMGYSPFWGDVFSKRYFKYDDAFYWGNLFSASQTLYIIWGLLIIACLTIYCLATVAFGYRFSNLTYRGLISSGVYRLTKHPAYMFKNISWWLISVPFFPHAGWENALKTSLLLFGVNIIYFLRARTEENHLSNYPEYVEYAVMMNEKSIFRRLGLVMPFLRYCPERAKNSGSRVYKPFV